MCNAGARVAVVARRRREEDPTLRSGALSGIDEARGGCTPYEAPAAAEDVDDEEEEDLDAYDYNNGFIVAEAEDAGEDYQSGDSRDDDPNFRPRCRRLTLRTDAYHNGS